MAFQNIDLEALLRDDSELPTDVTFQVYDNDSVLVQDISDSYDMNIDTSKIFKAHKFLLAAVSPMFRRQFFGSLPETGQPVWVGRTSSKAFGIMLNFLYQKAGQFAFPCGHFACLFEVKNLGEKYQITDLVKKTDLEIVNRQLTHENLIEAAKSAKSFHHIFPDISDRLIGSTEQLVRTSSSNKTHLENEGWALCPVKDNFSLLMLSEFSHLRSGGAKVSDSPSKNHAKSWFDTHWEEGSPFDNVCECEGGEEDILLFQDGTEGFYSDESDDDLSEDQKREIMNENTESRTTLTPLKSVSRKPVTPVIPSHKSSILLSNTALMLLRLFGKYSHMIKMLPVISGEVFSGITQLFDFYVFSVHAFFASDLPENEAPQVYTANLKVAIKRMYSEVILHEVVETPPNTPAVEIRRQVGLVQEAQLSPGVELDNPESLHGLSERAVAVESAVFLSRQLVLLKPYLEKSLPAADRSHLEKWYNATVHVTTEIRSPVYMCIASRAVRADAIIPLMGRVAWDIREVHSQHSPYVEHLLRDLQVMSSRLASIPVPLSKDVKCVIWTLATQVASNIFVEGFAGAKKCTNEGRAIMQLDYRQFVLKLEKISHVKPVPYQDFVSNYIKAYYIPEAELETWVQQHTEYSNRQLVALVNSVAYNNNKTKQKLNNIINDLSFRIRR